MSPKYVSSIRESGLTPQNAEYIDQLFEAFKLDPNSVPVEWKYYFYGFDNAQKTSFAEDFGLNSAQFERIGSKEITGAAERLISAYRYLGHLYGNVDPLSTATATKPDELNPGYYGLDEQALEMEIDHVSIDPINKRSIGDIVEILDAVYCGSLTTEYQYITDPEQRRWIEQRLESTHGDWQGQLDPEYRIGILKDLTAAEGLEQYLHRKYIGQKRFSLEGGDALIPLLDEVVQRGGTQGISHIVIGMAHRGRLNVLINLMGKSPQELFAEFEGHYEPDHFSGSGDVKYHQGFYSNIRTPNGPVHVSLAFNPSHLEIVSPVVEGGVRARQDKLGEAGKEKVLPLLIHGDAAFIGQGVTTETLNLSKTPGYRTGGTLHVVVNNQIGFTTSLPLEARSTLYCTDAAKLIQAPVFHVNGDDPDAVVFVTQLALDYRNTFNNDVVIDLVCYRRQGHNEADEPMVTQPAMYRKIREMETTRAIYARRLIRQQIIASGYPEQLSDEYRKTLDAGRVTVMEYLDGSRSGYDSNDWNRFIEADPKVRGEFPVALSKLIELGEKATAVPEGFTLHGRANKVLESRRKMVEGEQPLDWGMAENLAFATLLDEGASVRLSGQDCGRGTFAHRHAVLHDQENDEHFIPLTQINEAARFEVINSMLSELAVLAFEYGYATSSPNTLVIWEAQFGDFANCAQVVIDQFISSGYLKWGRFCQLTLFLPHGFEGQGPEHSSARLERFLQLCAELNMRVWNPTTPAQLFHLLRDQYHRDFRRPLVVMTPKSLLRHPMAVSSLQELSEGRLKLIIEEVDDIVDHNVRRVVLCSGKVYFELLKARRVKNIDDIAILRVEQLYPFPRRTLKALLESYVSMSELVWCQEEPRNQGAWYQIQHHLRVSKPRQVALGYAGRAPSASPACGNGRLHQIQQQDLIEHALSEQPVDDPGERLEDRDIH
ncbi:2-oxoglutarate dehydrogenase E1 component [Sedimenticola sp.]|uniref:2-oxoglutarate dehydrogenase E1 component n=1 Tax=Sedimenticola sp. TaxID=1940285 RepID=UPI003D0AA9C4